MDYEAMLGGGVRALYVMGADPARHATPEQLAQLDALDFLVVQDLCLTETAKRASVVLPAVAYTEKDGTFTNTERAVQVVRRAMMELPGRGPTGRFSRRWRTRLVWTGATARQRKFWRRSGVSCRCMRASRGVDWVRKACAGH